MPRWDDAARQRQAELIRTWEPWRCSTGPVTPEGKARSSRNAELKGARLELRLIMTDFKRSIAVLKRAGRLQKVTKRYFLKP